MRFENITYQEATRLHELEEEVRNYLHTNYPKVRADIWADNRHRLTLKKTQRIVKLSLDKKDTILFSLITDFALDFNTIVKKNKK